MDVTTQALDKLAEARKHSDSVIVSYSGGKDSRVVLDMCVRTFPRVYAFTLYIAPGLQYVKDVVDDARKRWGVEVVPYPDFGMRHALVNGVFCDPLGEGIFDPWDLRTIYSTAEYNFNCGLIATGMKRADGLARRHLLRNIEHAWPDVIAPIIDWKKLEVLAYLKVRGIPIPPMPKGAVSTGINISPRCLLRLYREKSPDFDQIAKYFPYVRAVAKREELYGHTEEAEDAADEE